MHSDRITDFPDFLFLRWVTSASKPLEVYGPEGTQGMIDGFLMAMRRDIGYRIAHHGDKLHPEGIKVEVTEISASASPTIFLEAGDLRVEAFTVDHFPVVPAFGFRTRCGGRSVVFSGDTSKCDSVLEASTGTDMLVCEALNVTMLRRMIEALKPNAPLQAGNLEDVPSYHISTLEVAELARDAGVGEVVLTHLLPTIASQDAMEAFVCAGNERDLQRQNPGRPRHAAGGGEGSTMTDDSEMFVASLRNRIRAMNELWDRAIIDMTLE